MPSRGIVAMIAVFWLGTVGLVGYRDVWPRYMSDGPPPIRIDLADEAAQAAPVRWIVYRGPDAIGKLTTRMDYVPEDDSFRFMNAYSGLTFDVGVAGAVISAPRLETSVRVGRAGDLKEQRLSGDFAVTLHGLKMAEASAQIDARVENGVLGGRCKLSKSPFGDIDAPLDPVPVSGGQVLSPMMPVNRLADVRPGRRWVIRETNPLGDALDAITRETARKFQVNALVPPRKASRELLAEVKADSVGVERKNQPTVECWLIEYRSDEVSARTWVAVSDGRVIRQEASAAGERLRFERED